MGAHSAAETASYRPAWIDSVLMRVPPARVCFPAEDRAEILARIDEALTSGQLTLGPIGRELEAAFAKRHSTRHAVRSARARRLEIVQPSTSRAAR